MKIGLFFGTFNPVHLGHEEIVSQLLDLNLFDQIWIILTPNSPHKNFDIVKKEERFYMLRKAFENFKNIVISDVEFNLKKPNYTIDTLNYLGEQFPKYIFSIIMGSDNYVSLKSWKNSNEIMTKHDVYIYPRFAGDAKLETHYQNGIFLNLPEIKISSTMIRNKIHLKSKALNQYLNPDVLKYIRKNNLY